MIRLPLNEIKSGQVLAKSILNDGGDLLLASGFVINDRVLGRMHAMGLPACWIYEEGTEFVVPEEVISEQLANQIQGALKDNADLLKLALEAKESTLEGVRKVMGEPARYRNILTAERMKSVIQELLTALLEKEQVQVNLSSIRSKNSYLHQHSVDVTLTALIIAQHMKYSPKELEELAMGTLFMDIGMTIISDAVIMKPGAFSEDEISLLREHPTFGFAILRENERIPLTTAHVAYQHHERQDGNGFPRRLKGDNTLPMKVLNAEKGRIHRYAEIASVADAYVSLIAPRPGVFLPKTPEEALRILIVAAGTHLNRAIVDTLITLIPIYPVGSMVTVITDKQNRFLGFSGAVVQYRPERPDQPVILIIRDRDKKKMKPVKLDLLTEPGMKIQFCRLG